MATRSRATPPAGGGDSPHSAHRSQRSSASTASSMPKIIRRNRYCYRVSYVAANGIALWLLASIPHSSMEDPDTITGVVLSLVMTFVAYGLLQASDPGYLSKDNVALRPLADATAEEATLMMVDVAVDEDAAGGTGLPTAAGASAGESKGTDVAAPLASPPALPDSDAARVTCQSPSSEACDQCHIVKMVRSRHCKLCDRCVACFDHHCTLLGTCIGERNHCRFWWFLLTQTITLAVGISIAHSGFRYRSHDWLAYNSYAISAAVLLWVLQAIVFPLFCFHTWLAVTNGTTVEFIKGPQKLWYLRGFKECDLPFSNGIVNNLRLFCCVADGAWTRVFNKPWRPTPYEPPKMFNRDSDDVWESCWENKYWSCC